MNIENITTQVADIAREVGAYIKSQRENIAVQDVEHKGVHDLVTFVDKEAERIIVNRLSSVLPQAGYIAEENKELKKQSEYNWIIDPLDGTTNFVHGVPVYSVSIALQKEDEIIAGVVYEVNLAECFYAWKGGGAWLNHQQIKVSPTTKLNDALLATGFPYADYSLLKPYLNLFGDMMENSRGVRRLGSAAADLAYLACGRFDVFYEYGLNPWDVAAGIIIVKEAGGKVTDFKNGSNFLHGRQIIASNTHLHNEFFGHLQRHFDNDLAGA